MTTEAAGGAAVEPAQPAASEASDQAAETTVTQGPEGKLRFGWQDVLIVGPIVVNTIYYYVGLPLNALVGSHPLLHAALWVSGQKTPLPGRPGGTNATLVPTATIAMEPLPLS